MDSMILGRYVSGNSIIHRLDPRSKLLSMFFFILIIFLANNIVTNELLFVFLIAFTTLFQLLFTSDGTTLFQFGFIRITEVGLAQAGIIFSRFLLIIIFSTLLTLTTMPLSLADAVESLLQPLVALKVPVHEIGLMLSMSLRFVPTLMDDTTRIMNAQRARGVDFGEGNIVQKVKSIIPILIPLFASSFKRADALATAMEARGYQGGVGRSRYRQLRWKKADTLSIFIMFALGLMLFFLKS